MHAVQPRQHVSADMHHMVHFSFHPVPNRDPNVQDNVHEATKTSKHQPARVGTEDVGI